MYLLGISRSWEERVLETNSFENRSWQGNSAMLTTHRNGKQACDIRSQVEALTFRLTISNLSHASSLIDEGIHTERRNLFLDSSSADALQN